MLDLYGLPDDFPGYDAAGKESDVYRRVACLENALSQDIDDRRFVPYIQLHEFEALLFCDPQKLAKYFPAHQDEIHRLLTVASAAASPELINDSRTTAPSKRIIAAISPYERQKAEVGPSVAEEIGVAVLRKKCRHFDDWLTRLGAKA